MLERGADPYQLAAMVGLDITAEDDPMTVIRHLVAALSQSNKRERQQNLSLDDIVDLIKSKLTLSASLFMNSRVKEYHDPDWRGNQRLVWNSRL